MQKYNHSVNTLPLKLVSWAKRIQDPTFRPELLRRLKRKAKETLPFLSAGHKEAWKSSKEECARRAVTLEEFFQQQNIPADIYDQDGIDAVLKENEESMKHNTLKHYVGPANLKLLYNLCEYLKVENVLETGVAHGWSSLVILSSLKKRDTGHLISTDLPPTYAMQEDYVGLAVPDHLKSKWTLIRAADREGLTKVKKDQHMFDMVHYDSDKTYDGRLWGYQMMFDMLKPGGAFISDDIDDNFGFLDFCRNKNIEPIIIKDPENQKYEGLFFKPK